MKHSLLSALTSRFTQAIRAAFPETDMEAEVTPSTQERFGHYQCNSAMKLAKALKSNPRQVAQKIVGALGSDPMIESLELAGPGFINIRLSREFLSERTDAVLRDPRLGLPPLSERKRVVVEFSSPNIAKEMHVGHLRSTIIGECLARLLEFAGYDVVRLNHVGDWGTQFGMLIAYLKRTGAEQSEASLPQLMEWYRESKQLFDTDEAFKKQSLLEVVALQGGDEAARAIWRRICEISRKGFQEIYDLLDVMLTERGESTYNPVLGDIVAELEQKGLVSISEGAKVIYLGAFRNREGDELPMIIQKRDGGYLYATTDLAALKQRVEGERADWLIYVTDLGQATHFAMLFSAAERASWYDPKRVRIDHVPFGLVLGPDGKKFRTRSGETERLSDLLETAIAKARSILEGRDHAWAPGEIDDVARALGLGAVKYADLACQRTKDYSFSYDRMLRFEGNTAAFAMYSYVRVEGIKRKTGADIDAVIERTRISLEHLSEVALGLHLCRFAEMLESVERDLLPNRLTDYVHTLAELFNAFFRDCRVEGSERQDQRLALCEAVACVMRQGLSILGLETVERM